MGRERQKVQLFKLWQHRRVYFKNDLDLLNQNDQVEPNMLAELKAELGALTDSNDQNSINKSLGGVWKININLAELTDENANPKIQSQRHKLGMLTKGNSYHNFNHRIMSQNFGAIESDIDSIQLSNYENQDLSTA